MKDANGLRFKTNTNKYIGTAGGAQEVKAVEEASATNYFSIVQKSGSPAGVFNLLSNGNTGYLNRGGGGNKLCVWNAAGDANGKWELIPVNCDDFCNVTLNVTLTLNTGATQSDVMSGKYIPGQEISFTLPAYTEVASSDVPAGGAEAGSHTYNVELREALPFRVSAGTDNLVWQIVDIHAAQSGLNGVQSNFWIYNNANQEISTQKLSLTQYEALGDAGYWAFTGDIVNGFKIYNKAAGTAKTLRKEGNDNDVSLMSETDDNNLFTLVGSNTLSGATCFLKKGGTYYLNMQNSRLQGWDVNDGGSSCRFFAPGKFLNDYAKDLPAIPAGAVGGMTWLDAEGNSTRLKAALGAVQADLYDTEKVTALSALTKACHDGGSNGAAFESGKLYRILNVQPSNSGTKYMISANAAGRICGEANNSNAYYIWRMDAVEGTENFKLYNMNYKSYMKGSGDNGLASSAAEGAAYILTSHGDAQYSLKDAATERTIVRLSTSGGSTPDRSGTGFGTWTPSKNGDGVWYFIPAEDIDVALNAAGDASWASIYMPFPVAAADGTDIFTGVQNGNVLNMTEATALPAEKGAILKGTGASCKLNIVDAAADVTSELEGTLTGLADIDKNAYYILGNGAEGVGLYHPNSTTLLANKAYLHAESLPANGLTFRFSDTTGIEGIEARPACNAAAYDLAGRRVTPNGKGIYVIGGKKVLVK